MITRYTVTQHENAGGCVSGSDGYLWWLWLKVAFSCVGSLQLTDDGQQAWVMVLVIINVGDWW